MSNNKALKMSEIVFVKYLFKKDWAPLEEIVDRYSKEFGDIYDIDNEKEVTKVITASPATLVLASVATKEDLGQILSFLKTQRKRLKDGNIKISVVNYLNNKQVEAALIKLGCQEVMDPSMKSWALKFRMDLWKKALSISVNKTSDSYNGILKVKAAEAKQQKTANEAKAVEAKPIVWTEPLKHVDDMWINKSQSDVKKVLSRWMVKIMGPSPFVAQWTEVQGQRGVWQFVFKEGARDNFHMSDSDWYFTGDQKPEFIWKENLWLISGHKFQLYCQEENETFTRFRANPQTIEVTKNSSYALSREKLIIETFDQQILVTKEMLDNSNTALEEDEQKGDGTLEQKIDGANKLKSHLQGKVKQELPDTPEEAKIFDGKGNRIKKHYEGESETDNKSSSHYHGKLENQGEKNKKDKLHNARSDKFGIQDGDGGTDDEGPDKYKGRTEYQKTDRKSNYGGKSETDDLDGNNWSNQNDQAEVVAKKEQDEAEADLEDGLKGADQLGRKKVHPLDAKTENHYRGKSSTDKLGDSHYSNTKESGLEDKPEKEKSQKRDPAPIQEDEEEDVEDKKLKAKKKVYKSPFEDSEGYVEGKASGLRGKSRTDNLGNDHYSGKNSRLEVDEEEKDYQSDKSRSKKNKTKNKEISVVDEENDKDYRGESSTDELGTGHYKGRIEKNKSAAIKEEELKPEIDQQNLAKGEKKQASIREKKMSFIDDLLPEGNAEDPMEDFVPKDFVPEGFDDALNQKKSAVSPVGPRLVESLNNEDKLDEPKQLENFKKDRLAKIARESVPSLADEEPTSDDDKPIVNADAAINVILRRKANPGVERNIRLDDFFENTAIVQMEGDCLKSGELVELTLTFDYMKKSKRINVNGICLESDQNDTGEAFCTIQIEKADLKTFEQFMLLFQLRQQHVHQFLKTAKGY